MPVIAAIGLNSQADINQNLPIITRALAHSADRGAHLVVLPENAFGMLNQPSVAAIFDELCDFSANLARKHGVHLLVGSLPAPNKTKYHQRSLLFNQNGDLIAHYDKIHLFYANVDGVIYDEGQDFVAGDTPIVASTTISGEIINIGMMICFDLRFDLARRLSLMGADIISAPAAFTHATGKKHWQALLVARALDSQCMVVGAAMGGVHRFGELKRETWGHSMIVDADGAITHAKDFDGFSLAMMTFDKSKQQQIRQHLNIGNPY